jgi:hypothetical protein
MEGMIGNVIGRDGFNASGVPSGYFYKSANTASNTAMAVAGTFYKVAGTTVLKSAASNMVTMPSNNRLTYTGTRDFRAHVTTTISIKAPSAWDGFNCANFLNGSIEQSTDRALGHMHSGLLGNEYTATSKFVMSQNDYVELFATNTISASTNFDNYAIAMNITFEGWA